MGKGPLKKGERGAVTQYIPRGKAIKKLQVSLADFRRLCIIKGIYPHEPRNKKKVGKGSTAARTYYYVKDIAYLQHEPLLQKFREFKTFLKRVKKAIGKDNKHGAERLEENKPVYTLHHVVKERYPTFADALRDLDDALCMVFLFARLPKTNRVNVKVIEACRRLSTEFENYVVRERALRKVFLSIKGIYYQAEVCGQTLTWIVPYPFTQEIPDDVDFKIMLTFVEFYSTLLGFVNFRLYQSLNLSYPPKIDERGDNAGAGLSALIVEPVSIIDNSEADERPLLTQADQDESAERLASLQTAISSLGNEDDDDVNMAEQTAISKDDDDDNVEFEDISGGGDALGLATSREQDKALASLKALFSGCKFFLSREVPKGSLEIVIRAFGGEVSWESSVAGGAPYSSDDQSITHQIVDRPNPARPHLGRAYIQPQWVYDSINERELLSHALYAPGADLPAHLSPFVTEQDGDYIPMERRKRDNDEEIVEDDDENGDQENYEEEEEGDEVQYAKELAMERKGVAFSEQQATTPSRKSSKKRKASQVNDEEDPEEMAKIMMTNKTKNFYERIQRGKEKRQAKAVELETRRIAANKKTKRQKGE